MHKRPPPTDLDIMARVGLLLRAGVVLSACILVCGGALYLKRHATEPAPDRSTFRPPEFSRPGQVLEGAFSGRARAIIQAGILVLLATPVLRVAYTAVAFGRRRDVVYVAFPLLVLLVLLAGYLFEPARLE